MTVRGAAFLALGVLVQSGVLPIGGWYAVTSPSSDLSFFAASVAGLPDVNGDGRGDLAIGAPISGPGHAYIVDGSTGQIIHTLDSPDPEDHGHFGSAVGAIPDLDGDGVFDVVVGASQEDSGPPTTDEGRAHVFSGATGILLFTLNSTLGWFDGDFGGAVDGVPDVNGDGRGDIIVGAREEYGRGRAYLFSGADGSVLDTFHSPFSEQHGHFGESVSGIADLDSDGRGDVIIGAGGQDPARVYVFSGASGQLLHTITSPAVSMSSDYFGHCVDSVDDVDGDQVADIVIGAHAHEQQGRAYLVSGKWGVILTHFDSPDQEMGGSFGFGVSGVPDVNGDGRGDVLIGASSEDPCTSPTSAGRAYLFSGATRELLVQLRSPNEDAQGQFGHAVAGIPDLNDDGRGDGVVYARQESPQAFYVFSLAPESQVFADLDDDFLIGSSDLGLLLECWGACGTCDADLDCNGIVSGFDLALLLGAWS